MGVGLGVDVVWEKLRRPTVVVSLAAAAVLFGGAQAVMAFFAGWTTVVGQLRPHLSFWFAVAFAAERPPSSATSSPIGAVARVEGGPVIGLWQAARLVAVGFGAFLAKGGGAVDSKALGRRSAEKGEVRVLALDALEHAPLAPAARASAVALLVEGKRKPGLDFSIPWSTLVPTGAVLAVYGVRHRRRFAGKSGWRGGLGEALQGIHLLFQLVLRFGKHWPAFLGATVYWAGDVACLWACLRPFAAAPSVPAIILAHAVGYVLTRRTPPFAGAGIVEVLMPQSEPQDGAASVTERS